MLKNLLSPILLISLLSACGSESESLEAPDNKINTTPIALTASVQLVDANTTVYLDASMSSDKEDNFSELAFQWSRTTWDGQQPNDNLSINISSSNTATPSFIFPAVTAETVLYFKVTVTDTGGLSSSKIVPVTGFPRLFVKAQEDFSANAGDKVYLQSEIVVSPNNPKEIERFWFQQTENSSYPITIYGNASRPNEFYFVAPYVDEKTDFVLEVRVWEKVEQNETGYVVSDTVTVSIEPSLTTEGGTTEGETTEGGTTEGGTTEGGTTEVFVSRLNDTGYTLCANTPLNLITNDEDHNNSIDCKVEKDNNDYPVPRNQDGHQGRDATNNDDSDGQAGFSFTKIGADGNELTLDAIEWSCVKDNVTGLTWEVKTNDGGLQDRSHTYTWYDPDGGQSDGDENNGVCDNTTDCDTDKFINRINEISLCGMSEWRLPSREELRSITNYAVIPTVDTSYFPNTLQNTYWTGEYEASSRFESSFLKYFSSVKQVNFGSGSSGADLTNKPTNVRLVHDRFSLND